jgi:hypothetical protein
MVFDFPENPESQADKIPYRKESSRDELTNIWADSRVML